MNIILMGYRCTGKTAAGLRLAGLLGRPFYDTDEMIRRRTGRTVEEIVAGDGWDAFRRAEGSVIRELSQTDRSVIALGGGAILDPRNTEALRGNALFIWLIADEHVIVHRMEKDSTSGSQRPSLTGRPSTQEVREIMAEREPLYRQIADLVVDTAARTAQEVAEAICSGLQKKMQTAGDIECGEEA
jgi:shikimate kinase